MDPASPAALPGPTRRPAAPAPPRPGRPGRRRSGAAALAAGLLVAAAACSGSGTTGTTGTAGGTAAPGGPATSAAPATAPATAAPAPARALVIAHRGASADAPEHTFASWDRAVEQGADHLEIDLQITADGELVVLHDPTLDRTARGPAGSCTGEVSGKTLAQLRECEVGSWFNDAHPDLADPSFVGQRIPTLEEVLDRYGVDHRYYIETKAAGAGMEQPLVALLEAEGLLGGYAPRGQVIVQSFAADSLRTLRDLREDLELVQLLAALPPTLDDVATYADGIGPASGLVDAALVDAAHQRCLVVHPYTVDDPAAMAALLDLGVDGLFTNTPDTAVAVRDDHAPPPDHC